MFGVVRLAESGCGVETRKSGTVTSRFKNGKYRGCGKSQRVAWQIRTSRIRCVASLQEARGNAVVAIELHIVVRSGDTVPARHRCRLDTLHVGARGKNNVSVTQRSADQHNFQFDRGTRGKRLRTQKIHARRTEVTRYVRNTQDLRNST